MAATRHGLWLLAGVAPLLCAGPTRAAEPFQVYGGGVYVGYAYGEHGGFQWGVEGFATRTLEPELADCFGSDPRYGFGPMARLGMVQLSTFEATLAAHGGGELARSYFALDGELGGKLELRGDRASVVPHTGVTFESIIFNLYFRQAWLPPTPSVGAGARYLPTFGTPAICMEGRPFRDQAGRSQSAQIRTELGFDAREPRARLWARRAAEECASVPAFLQLAIELSELRAPVGLVQRALQAAEEELGHARDAAALASLYGDGPVSAVPPAFRRRTRLPRLLALRRLAEEAWTDGCLNESLSARIAAAEAGETRVREEASVLARIAGEEAGHGTLAEDVLAWALAESPDAGRNLRAGRASAGPSQEATFLSSAAARELWEQTLASAAAACGVE